MTLYNSLTKTNENFAPKDTKKVTLYVCGITPYDTTHLGHAFTYISFDVLVRYLQYKGYEVMYTQNVTDINDRDNDILKRALQQKTTWQELSTFWTNTFLTNMQKLNWIKPTNYLFASQNIASMIPLIQKILECGIGYQKKGGIYLDISKVKNFGKLSRLSQKQMLERAKEFEEDITNPDKVNPLDITLWRPSLDTDPKHIPSFDSPFGKGRPGWHIECSGMSIQTLGEQIDIHGGGIDLIYPHHESEIAQSESATHKIPFAKFWLHTGTVSYEGKKMSKSLGNLVLVSKLLEKYSANAIRWVLLSHQWNNDWEYFEDQLKIAEKKIHSLSDFIHTSNSSSQDLHEFESFLDNNLNTPAALEYIEKLSVEYKDSGSLIGKMLHILGFKNVQIPNV